MCNISGPERATFDSDSLLNHTAGLQPYGGYRKGLGSYKADLDHGAAAAASTHSDVVQDPLELQRLVLPLHGSRIQAIAAVDELDDVAGGAAHRQVVLRAKILQGLDKAPLQDGGRKHTRNAG